PIASAPNGKRDAVGGDPATFAVVGLPLMNDVGIQRCGGEDCTVKIDRNSWGRMKSGGEPEEPQPALAFGLHEVSSALRSHDGMMNTGVLQREWKRRNDIHEIQGVHEDEDSRTGGDNGLCVIREALFGAFSQDANKKPPQHQAQGSAEQEDQTSHGVEHHGQDENHEAKQRKKKQAELKLQARVPAFELFI